MAEERIDSLSIEIETSAERAVKGLDNLAKSTDKVGKALKNVKTSGLDKVSKDAVDSAKSVQNLNSKMESLFAKGEAAGKKFFSVDNMGLKEAEKKLEVLKNSYDKAMDTINTKMTSGIFGGTTFENQVIQAGKLAVRMDMLKERIQALKSAQDSMKPVDFWDRADWNETPIDANQVGQALSDIEQEYLSTFSNISSEATNVGQNIQEAMQAPVNNEALISIKEQIAQLKDEQNQIGQAIQEALNPSTYNSAAKEFERVGVETEKATSAIQRFKEWMHSGTEDAETMKEAFSNLAKFTFSSIFDLPKNLAEQFKKATSAIHETKKKLDEVKGQRTQQNNCGDEKQQNKCPKEMDECFKKVSKSSKAFSEKLKNVGGFMKKLVPNAKSLRGALSGLGLTNNKLVKSLTRTGKMLKLMVVRMALRGVITGAKEGFQNLIQYSDSTKASMQQLVSSLDYLKNSFAAAFAPIINTVAPIISTFIDYLVSAVNAINQLVSSLLGFSTWTKATKLVSNYGNAVGGAGKAAKDLNKQLQGFDELNNLTTNQGGGSGGGGASTPNYADMFTTEEVDGYWKSIADKIKDSWNFDDADFTWLGSSLGEKISEQLDGLIEKHPKIKDNARKIGKALGTTITGFVETPDLGYKVGTVIGNAIDTAVTGLDGFVSNVHWDSVGTFIGQGINGITQTDLINDVFTLFKDVINGGIDLLWNTANTTDFEGIGEKLGDSFTDSVKDIKARELGEALSMWIHGGLTLATSFLTSADFEEVGQKIADFISGIQWKDLLWDLVDLAGAIVEALVEAISGLWNDGGVAGKIGLAIVTLIGYAQISNTALGTALSGALGRTVGSGITLSNILGIGVMIGSIYLLNTADDIKGKIGASVAAAIGGKLLGLSGGQAIGLGLIIGSVQLFDTKGSPLDSIENLQSFIMGAGGTYIGSRLLGLSVSASLKVTLLATEFVAVENITEKIAGWLSEQIGDEGLAPYYKDFHWFGKDGFFDTILQDPGDLPKAWYDMWTDYWDWVKGSYKSLLAGLKQALNDFWDKTEEKIEKLFPLDYGAESDAEGFAEQQTRLASQNVTAAYDKPKSEEYQANKQAYNDKLVTSYNAAIKAGMSTQEAMTYAMQQSNNELKEFTHNTTYASDTYRKYTSNVKQGTAEQYRLAYANEYGADALKEQDSKLGAVKKSLSKLSTPFKNYGTTITNIGTKLKSLIGINDKTTKSNNDFSKSYQSNSDKVTKSTTGMTNNIQNSRANIIGSMDKIGLSFDGTYNKINTGADTSSKTIDAKFQYMKQMATAHTEEQRKAIETKYGQMLDTTKTNTGSMSSDVLSKFTAMNTNTSSKSQGMVDVLKKNLGLMKSNTNTETAGIASTVTTNLKTASNNTNTYSGYMKNYLSNNLTGMSSDTTSKTNTMLKTLTTWSSNATKTVNNTKGTAKFDVNTPTQSDIQNKWTNLRNRWTDWKSNFTVETESENKVKSIADRLKAEWESRSASASYGLNFTTDTNGVRSWVNNNIFDKINKKFATTSILKNFKIPFLAKGMIADKATLGLFGEAGTEMVAPLERNTEWIGKLSAMIVTEMPSLPSYQSSSNESAILEQNRLLAEQNALLRQIANKDVSISSRDIFDAVRNENNDYVNRTGASPFFV